MLKSKVFLFITILFIYSLPYALLMAGAVILLFGFFAHELPKKTRAVSMLIGSVLLLLFALTRNIFVF